MKIGVDLGHIAEGESGGIVPYLQGLLGALFANWPEHEIVIFATPGNRHMFPAAPGHVQQLTLDVENYHTLLDVCATSLRLDVLFTSYPSEADATFPLARRVVLIPDCQHDYFPEFFDAETLLSRRRAFDKVMQGAGAVATLSEHATRTLLNYPGARCTDVFVSSPALSAPAARPATGALTGEERALLPRGDYFLYPANLWPHKNHRRVLEAFAGFLRAAPRRVEFVFTGHPRGWAELRRDFPNLPVRHLGFVRREFLQVLLARARALIFFSLFEGFGIPLLEAFAVGTPVACSDTTSLPEVGADAVLSCDPTDVAAMSECMARIHTDEGLRARLVDRGRGRLARYDWRSSAARLIEACERVRGRIAGEVPSALPALQQMVRSVADIQADRAARLEVIQNLDTQLRASVADRVAQVGVIQELCEALRGSADAPQALEGAVERLETVLRESMAKPRPPLPKRVFQWLRRNLPRPFAHAKL